MASEGNFAKRLNYLPPIVIVSIAAVYGAAILIKGPTLDEFWTLFYTDPRISRDLAWQWWSSDTGHPVAYYSIMRFFFSVLPESVTVGRIMNAIPLGMFIYFAAWAPATARIRRFSGTFLTILLCTYVAVERFSEMRAYFWSIALLGSLLVVLRLIFARIGMSWRVHLALTVITVAVAGFDYMAFAAANAALCSACVILFATRRGADCAKIGSAVVAGWIAAGLSLWNALHFPVVPAPYYVDIRQFAINLAVVGGLALIGNLVVTGLAGQTAIRAMRGGMPQDETSAPGEWEYVASLALAVALGLAGFALLNALSHVMVKRQLFGLAVLICGLIAALSATSDAVSKNRRWIAACMAVTLAINLAALWLTPNFRRHGPALAQAQRQCPSYRIFALDYLGLAGPPQSLNGRHAAIALDRGYRTIANDYGFRLSDPGSPRAFDSKCGGAVWFEEAWTLQNPKVEAVLQRSGFTLEPGQIAGAHLQQDLGSVLITVRGSDSERTK